MNDNKYADIRRKYGVHYTSVADIHRVIDPLFLDALHDEFDAVKRKTKKNRRRALKNFQDKLAGLTFFDPACGSGNFLTETFISLRQLENKILGELINLGEPCTVKVSIDQFYGIELNGFACAIAQTAMQISEHKMLCDTDVGIRERIQYLPLKHSARIVCGNALTLDWRDVVPDGVDYIIGNPPFVGMKYQTDAQRNDIKKFFANKDIDYVACWFKKAADFMIDTDTRAAFVATDSVTQGEQTCAVWRDILSVAHIDFARRSFRWTSESENKAAVNCVIVGFSSAPSDRPRIIFDGDQKIIASNINGYLLDAPDIYIESRSKPLCDVPEIHRGNQATDGGNLIIEADEYEDFVRREPRAQKYIRRYMMGDEFINGRERWCLWLVDASEDDLKLPLIAERVEGCRRFRLKSSFGQTVKMAATPHLFREQLNPEHFIAIPIVSSGRRRYIPMGYLDSTVIVGAKIFMLVGGGLYEFGVLMSSVHMAWTRRTCGRLGSGYSYLKMIVYNNFPWAEPTDDQRLSIENSARKILDVRALYPDRTLAWLYNEATMPDDLRAAHVENDRHVMDLYGFDESMSEAEIVSRLMEMYQRLSEELDMLRARR